MFNNNYYITIFDWIKKKIQFHAYKFKVDDYAL